METRPIFVTLGLVVSLAIAWLTLEYLGANSFRQELPHQSKNAAVEPLTKDNARLAWMASPIDPHTATIETGRFNPAPPEAQGQISTFRHKPVETRILAGANNSCLDLDIDRITRQNSGFRAGFTEINETHENANKISLSRVNWRLGCQDQSLVAEGEVRHPGYGSFSVRLIHVLTAGIQLGGIRASWHPDADRQISIMAIELRSNEQRRGLPLGHGIQSDSPSTISYDSKTIGMQAASDASVLYRNSEWLDLALKRGTKKIRLSLELPVLQEQSQLAQ